MADKTSTEWREDLREELELLKKRLERYRGGTAMAVAVMKGISEGLANAVQNNVVDLLGVDVEYVAMLAKELKSNRPGLARRTKKTRK